MSHYNARGIGPLRPHSRRSGIILLILVFLLQGFPLARADSDATVHECTEAAFDDAMLATAGGGTIFFACDTPAILTLTQTKQLAGNRRISGNGVVTIAGTAARLFEVLPGATVMFDGLTLSGGEALGGLGGAILNNGALELDDVALLNNQAANGGAIYNTGSMTITNGVLRTNSATGNGGAVANAANASAQIVDTVFDGNQATLLGGAIYSAGQARIQGGTLSNNQAAFGGGLATLAGTATIDNITIAANQATHDAGGLYNQGDLSVAGTTFSANRAAESGGGIQSSGTLTVTNSTLNGNQAASGGGLANLGQLALRHATIADNQADAAGGLANGSGAVAELRNTLIAANRASDGNMPDCAGAPTSLGNNLVQRPDGCGWAMATGDLLDIDPLLAPLADNGGPTKTQALLPGSPAVDAGDASGCSSSDQRGVGRPAPVAGMCDIGAFEQGFVVTSALDEPDENPRDAHCLSTPSGVCTLRAAIQQANADRSRDSIQFAISSPITLTIPAGTTLSDANGNLDITDDLLVVGNGAAKTIIDGGGDPLIGGVFQIAFGITVAMVGVTIRNGVAGANAFGGAIRNDGHLRLAASVISNNGANAGGGITNIGQLELTTSTIRNNTAANGGGIYNRFDGGIDPNGGVLSIRDSTISGNTATAEIGGGGILDEGDLTLENVTISGNTAARDGGGLRIFSNGADGVMLKNVTVAGNIADSDADGVGDGGGINSSGARTTVTNTIIATNTDGSGQTPDCVALGGALTSLGYNLVGDTSGCTIEPVVGDTVGSGSGAIDPVLGQLQDRGGPTLTMPPLNGSPVVNKGSPASAGGLADACARADQRGLLRPQGAACDIGASEAILADLAVEIVAAPTKPLAATPFSYTLSIKNLGPSPTELGALRAAFNGAAVIAAASSQGSCTPAAVTSCAFGQIGAGVAVTVTLGVQAPTGGQVSANLSVRGFETDNVLTNNIITNTTTVYYPLYLPVVLRTMNDE